MLNLNDIIEPELSFTLDEKKSSEVDGVHILGKVKGQFFVPNGTSRNERYYPRELWEKVISDNNVQNKIQKRLMFGTIGHDAELGDKGVREGNASHVITKIYIDEKGRGMGEALILNTEVGRTLNTVLRAGSQLYVSSRADGTYANEKFEDMPVVDMNTYMIEGWDFVIDPGFLEAHPGIAESLNKIHNNIDKEGDIDMGENNSNSTKDLTMNEELIRHITNENAELKGTVKNLTDEVEALKEDSKAVTEENTHLKEENGSLEEANKKIATFEKFSTVEELEEKMTKIEEDSKSLASFLELADNAEETKQCLESVKTIITNYQEIGSVEEIKEALEKSNSFFDDVAKLGNLEEISKVIEAHAAKLEEEEKEVKTKEAKELAEALGISEEKIVALLEKYSVEDIKAIHEVKEAKITEEKEDDSDKYKKTNEEAEVKEEEAAPIRESRIVRLNKRFAR